MGEIKKVIYGYDDFVSGDEEVGNHSFLLTLNSTDFHTLIDGTGIYQTVGGREIGIAIYREIDEWSILKGDEMLSPQFFKPERYYVINMFGELTPYRKGHPTRERAELELTLRRVGNEAQIHALLDLFRSVDSKKS